MTGSRTAQLIMKLDRGMGITLSPGKRLVLDVHGGIIGLTGTSEN